ncbi:MAG: hypothetical protein K2L72_04835, partial [Clostridia bacterium]|nr:hypothetical protein [Clostridia bacterium]
MSGCTDNGKGNGPSTDITDPDVPLDPGSCKHTDVRHVSAKAAGCETGGNKEYWFCDDCDKYFSDEELTVETSLAGVTLGAAGHDYGVLISESSATCEKTGIIAHYHCSACNSDFDADKKPVTDLVIPVASHTYGEWSNAKPATCTENGVKAHKDCTVCEKHFDADNNEITDLVIVAGHAYGGLIAAVPAVGCTAGVKAHYHCDACNTDFDENKVEFNGLPFPIGNGLITIPAPHNIKDYPAEEASCIVDGHDAYRQCEDCEEYFDEFGNISFEQPVFLPGTHSFGEFEYDYAAKKYVKTCKHDSTHTIEQAAGTEEYPHVISSEAEWAGFAAEHDEKSVTVEKSDVYYKVTS